MAGTTLVGENLTTGLLEYNNLLEIINLQNSISSNNSFQNYSNNTSIQKSSNNSKQVQPIGSINDTTNSSKWICQ